MDQWVARKFAGREASMLSPIPHGYGLITGLSTLNSGPNDVMGSPRGPEARKLMLSTARTGNRLVHG